MTLDARSAIAATLRRWADRLSPVSSPIVKIHLDGTEMTAEYVRQMMRASL